MLHSMKLVPGIAWQLAGSPPQALDARLLPLLAALRTRTSLGAAALALGVSYRAVWNLLRTYHRHAGVPLVTLERGRGARLAPAGEALLTADAAARDRLQHALTRLTVEIGAPELRAPLSMTLRIVASHDLALAALRDALSIANGVQLEVAFKGSLEALAEYAAGRAEIAGFHMPVGRGTARAQIPFLRWLHRGRDRLIHFVEREQGLILPRGNPRRVRTLRDIATRRLTFVNRQRGSGTRLLIDGLLARSAVNHEALAGYNLEEHTHSAVAATVAAGRADAGFGVGAAAAEYGLTFVPLVRERYYFAVRTATLRTAPVERLIAALRGPMFAAVVSRLAGYDATGAGTVLPERVLPSTGARRTAQR